MAITYNPSTNFGAKDTLPASDPNRVVKGTEFSTEFDNISVAFGLAAPNNSPTFTGTATFPLVDINGGAIDGTTVGATTPSSGSFSSLVATTADINGGTLDATTIGAAVPAEGTFTTVTGLSGVIGAGGLSVSGTITGGTIQAATTMTVDGSNVATVPYVDAQIAAAELGPVSSIDNLADVDTSTVAPSSGQVLSWDTTNWVPATVVTPSYTGDVAITGELKADSYNESYATFTSSSNAATVDCESGNVFTHVLTENTTLTFSSPPATGTAYGMTVKIVQDASASGYTVTWPTSVDWPAATAPTLTATASAVDVFVFYTHDGGTTWYGFTAGQAMA